MSEDKHQIDGDKPLRLQMGKKSFAPEDLPRKPHAVTKNHHLGGSSHAAHSHGLNSGSAPDSSGLLRTDKRPSIPVKDSSSSNQEDERKTS